MPLGEGLSPNEREKEKHPPKRRYFTAIGWSSRQAAYHNVNMTVNDTEPPKYGVLVNFLRFRTATATHISRVNCAEMARDRPILSTECRFWLFKYELSMVQGGLRTRVSKKGTPLKSGYLR